MHPSPTAWGTRNGDDVFAAPRHAVEWTAIFTRRDLAIGELRLLHGELVGHGDDEVEGRVVAIKALDVHARQLDGADLPGFQQLREVRERPERDIFQVGGTMDGRCCARTEGTFDPIELGTRHQRAVVRTAARGSGRCGSRACPHSASGFD